MCESTGEAVYARAHRRICVYMDGGVLEKRPPTTERERERENLPVGWGSGGGRGWGRAGTSGVGQMGRERRTAAEEGERKKGKSEQARIDRRAYTRRQEELERQGELYAIGQPAHFLSGAGRAHPRWEMVVTLVSTNADGDRNILSPRRRAAGLFPSSHGESRIAAAAACLP